MTLAFQGLGYEYQSFIKERQPLSPEKRHKNDVKLYITKIENNCILAEFAPALPLLGTIAPILSDVNTVSDFVRNIGALIEWLKAVGKNQNLTTNDIPHSKKKINNLKDVVKLIAKNEDGNLGVSAIRYEESSGEDSKILEMTFTDKDCREATYGANRALQVLESSNQADHDKVLMYLYQTNLDDPKSVGRTGDKALISSISQKPLSVYIISDVDQQRIRYELDSKEHNPLHTGFVVDVNVEKDRKGQPKIYRVIRIHAVEHDDPD